MIPTVFFPNLWSAEFLKHQFIASFRSLKWSKPLSRHPSRVDPEKYFSTLGIVKRIELSPKTQQIGWV